MAFKLSSRFKPAGGQPAAIELLSAGLGKHARQTLLGITGSGKTFVMANVIANYGRPTLVLAHNKILAAQLYQELKELFPGNRVEYFISYYDYYQPESYIPTTDTYIEKDAQINEQIERMRLKATSSLLARDDVIVVASISCIYGLGDPGDFEKLSLSLEQGTPLKRQDLLASLVKMQYERNDLVLEQGNFRVRGDVIDIFPPYDERVIRVELFGDRIDSIAELNPLTQGTLAAVKKVKVFPAKQFVVADEKQERAIQAIEAELADWLPSLGPLEQERLRRRVKYDLELLKEVGYCPGIENYSRHFDRRRPGEPPFCLLNYFPKDFLLIIDESHQTIPQAHAMYKGDYARKKNLVDFGFRLPCAFDNRPLKFEEFEQFFNHAIFVSATPAEYETKSSGQTVELIIRPTGLLDPCVEVRPVKGHINDLITEARAAATQGARVLVTTLTKKMAEDLTDFMSKQGIKVRYMHSEIESLDRIEIIRQLRAGEFDVLVGINLLREGLDLPEVSLVAILDADKEGFLRNERSLIQTIGRAARNINGKVIMYADSVTDSMRRAIAITRQRRAEQEAFNTAHRITPQQIQKPIERKKHDVKGILHLSRTDIQKRIADTEARMRRAAEELQFEKAIELREELHALQEAHGGRHA